MKYVLLLSIFFICLSCNQTNDGQNNYHKGTFSGDTSGDRLYTTDAEDKGMNNAIITARNNLNQFDSALKSSNTNFRDFGLKKRFASGDSGEHIWLNNIELFKDGYKGVINNDPIFIKGIKLGDTVYVTKEEISDWMYVDKNILRGCYTLREELKRMSAPERTAILKGSDYKIEE